MERDQFLSGILQELEWEKPLFHLGQKSPKQQKNSFSVPGSKKSQATNRLWYDINTKIPGLQDPWMGTTRPLDGYYLHALCNYLMLYFTNIVLAY